ncbi:hypothetical protein [Streptomyces sp. NPDC005828]|uniref:hypothetical protein n=1 Tax=Streptomyces sp. NPDC005828 TaxID=3157071 RepID=UPI0033CC9EF8
MAEARFDGLLLRTVHRIDRVAPDRPGFLLWHLPGSCARTSALRWFPSRSRWWKRATRGSSSVPVANAIALLGRLARPEA